MSHEIPVAYVEKYRSDLTLLLQQKQSKLESCVRTESQSAQYDYYDQIGPVSAQPWGPRHGDTPIMETPHTRRRVGISPWIWADLIDKPDRLRLLIDPTSAYSANAVMAFNRRKDDIILAAALGTAYTGHEGETAVTFPSANLIPESGVLTVADLAAIKEMFWNNDLEEEIDGPQLYMAVGPNSIVSLLNDDQVTSADYNSVKALVRGDIDTFMGFKFIRTTRLPVVMKTPGTPANGYVRTNIAWVRDGLLLAKGEDINVQVTTRPDKKYATQVFASMDLGAVRMDEKKVVAINTLEMATPVTPAP